MGTKFQLKPMHTYRTALDYVYPLCAQNGTYLPAEREGVRFTGRSLYHQTRLVSSFHLRLFLGQDDKYISLRRRLCTPAPGLRSATRRVVFETRTDQTSSKRGREDID